jgi:hypothetical protein
VGFSGEPATLEVRENGCAALLGVGHCGIGIRLPVTKKVLVNAGPGRDDSAHEKSN